jgi:hypothetical protein
MPFGLLGDVIYAMWFFWSGFICWFSSCLLDSRDNARRRILRSAMQQQKYWAELMRDSLDEEDLE